MSTKDFEIRLTKTDGRSRRTRVWEGTADAQSIVIKYGIDGHKLRTTYIPLAQIPIGDTKRHLEELAQVRIQHGYQMSWKTNDLVTGPAQSEPKADQKPRWDNLKWGIEPPEWF